MTEAFDKLDIPVNLDAPDLGDGHELYAVLHSALKNRGALQLPNSQASQSFWPAEYFGLDQVSLFQQSDEAQRQTILRACGQNVLAESYYIEKCGMYFAAKMSLLATNTQERLLYSLFACDEAVHFNWIAGFISQEAVQGYRQNPFLRFIEEILQRADRATLAYIVQVILEGWGIHHYQGLSRCCLDAGLKKVFEAILKDEARHHASGLILMNEQNLTGKQIQKIGEILCRFFLMVQVGPQMIVAQIERVTGSLSKARKQEIFAELACQSQTAKKISVLQSLIKAAQYADVMLETLERAGAFRPFTAAECALV